MDDLLDHLGLDAITAVGTSLGAAVLWAHAELTGGRRVMRLVLVDQAPLQNRAPGWDLGSKGCYDGPTLARLQAAVRGDAAAFAAGNADACLARPIHPGLDALLAAETGRADKEALALLMADHTQA